MPLSEFQSFMKGKHDSGQPKVPNRSSPQSPFVPEHDFVELLWENGHVVQSNRPKKSPFPSAFPSLSGKAKEKEGRDAVAPVRDAVAPRSGRYGGIDALGNGLQATGPSGQSGLGGQDDELVPWLNCPIDDYCSEFLSEFSGINPNSLSSMVPTERISGFGQAARDVHGGAENSNGSRGPTGSSEASRMHSSPFFQFPQQYQMLSSGIVGPEVTMGAADQGHRGDLPATKIPKQDLTASMTMQAPNSSTPVMNFSHFSRPVALAKANLLGVDRARGSEKASTAASSNPLESALIEYAGGFKSVSASQGRVAPVTAKADLNPPVQPSAGMALVGHSSEAISQEDAAKDSRSLKKTDDPSSRRMSDHTRCQDSNFKAVGQQETENNNSCHEPAIASSSVCSAIGAGAAANDIRNRAKWRCTEGEESEYPSEQDHEDDSTDVVRRPVAAGAGGQGTSKKRSRAAEVHNLSERRRRDRINEKMRALQELIPNCNKVDKASMLDEAIEYLKTLQMQVQIMSMGGGLCMPPLMLPTGVQNMRAPHLGPFSPMAAVGMGMGMAGLGFGMGMLDMTRAPTLMPLPRVHGPPYPACASIPGTAGLHHGMPGSAAANLQMFGMPAGQPMPMSIPHPPPAFVPLVGGMATGVNPVPEEPVAEVQASDSTPPPAPKSKDQQQLNTIEQAAAKTSTVDTPAESSGGRANRECFELPSMVQIDDQPPNVGGT